MCGQIIIQVSITTKYNNFILDNARILYNNSHQTAGVNTLVLHIEALTFNKTSYNNIWK